MQTNKLSTLLWILSTLITTVIIMFLTIGSGLALLFTSCLIISLIGWLSYSYKKPIEKTVISGNYLVIIVLLMVLYTVRYASDFSEFIYLNYAGLFADGLIFDHTNWFVWAVCLPISMLLFGGYLISRNYFAGSFFVWFTLVYATLESLIQMYVELINISEYNHLYFAGILLSMVLFYLSIHGILRLIKRKQATIVNIKLTSLNKRQKNLWTILFASFILVYAITLVSTAGKLPLGVVVGSMVGGLIGWRLTTANYAADPQKFLPLYLLLLTFFFIHIGEEVLTHFNRDIAQISGTPWSDSHFDYLITFIGPIIWIYAAYSLWKGQAFGNFILWFMVVGMILGEPTHLLVFPIVKMAKFGGNYEYFSGMYTALFPMIPAIIALPMLIRDYKKSKTIA